MNKEYNTSGVVAAFLRRWSSVDITNENSFLFEEHLFGVKSIATKKEMQLLEGISKNTKREEFARRYKTLLIINE